MAAGGGDFEGPPRHLLAAHLVEVGQGGAGHVPSRQRAGRALVAGQVIGQRQQALGGDDVETLAGPGRLRPGWRGADQPQIAALGGDGGRQHASDMGQPPVQPQFAQRQIAIERILGNGADGGHDAQGNRQVIMAAFDV